MKKRFFSLAIILISLILIFGFSNSIFAEDLIHGVVPAKVTAHGIGTSNTGKWDFYLEFWNVGKLGGEQYAKATMREVLIEEAPDWTIPDNEKTVESEGYFTGGPNGTIYLSIPVKGILIEVSFKLKDGKEIIFDEESFLVDNPEAFKGWVD